MAVQVTGYLFAGRLGIPVGQSGPGGTPRAGACDDAMVAPSPQAPFAAAPSMAAFLRVYEPLDVLPDLSAAERAEWRALASSGSAAPAMHERAAALRAACALPPRVVGDQDVAKPRGFAPSSPPLWLLSPTEADGVVRACPADLSWRALIALEELRLRTVAELVDAVLPRSAVEQASRQLAERVAAGARPPHIRQSNWCVPLVWFAAFQPEQHVAERAAADQDVAERPPADQDGGDSQPLRSGVRSLRYRAPMADARRCVARALAVARRVERRTLPKAGLEELGRWLEEFHARSVVELDYGALVGLLAHGPRDSAADVGAAGWVDDSVDLVAAALADLRTAAASHDLDNGIARLEHVQARWTAVRSYERSS